MGAAGPRACAALLSLLLLIGGAGCILCDASSPDLCFSVFNQCSIERGDLLGETRVEMDLRQSAVWTREMPVGNLVADAFYATARRLCNGADRPCPDAAFENAGAIRYETKCGPRDLIPAGRIYQGDISQLLPFAADKMAIYDITGLDLKLALEHSVELLGRGRNSEQGGFFLQVSRLKFEVDCAQSPQARDLSRTTIEAPGARIVTGSLMIRTDSGGASDPAVWEAVVVDTAHSYRVVTNNFIGSGNDGFLALVARTSSAGGETAVPGPVDNCISDFVCKHLAFVTDNGANLNDAQMVEDYLKQQGKVAPVVEGRITIRPSCLIGE